MNTNDTHPFETNLDRHPSNYIPLSPVSFLTRAASAFADKVAVIDGERRCTYAQLLDRCIRLASGLAQLGVKRLDTANIAFSLMHGSTKVLIVDAEYAPLVRESLQQVDRKIVVIDIDSPDLP